MNIITLNRVLLNNTPLNYRRKRILTEKDFYFKTIERTFTFSKSAGGKSIKDGRAYIKRIKGNSVVWNMIMLPNQPRTHVSNGIMGVWDGAVLQLQGTIEEDGYVSLYSPVIDDAMRNFFALNHKYAVVGTSANFKVHVYSGVSVEGTDVITEKVGDTMRIAIRSQSAITAGTVINESIAPRIYDLTKMFQAGNEPTTIEEFNARVATLGVDMNAYNEGQVIHCNTESIKSVGDNAWDEEVELGSISATDGENIPNDNAIRPKNYIKILPNEQYHINIPFNEHLIFYDERKQFLSALWQSSVKTFTTPSNAAYMRFRFNSVYGTTYKHDIMITLVHSGWKQDTDAGYQPYWQDTLPLPIINNYFPQGMKSAGSAHDEIRYNKATKKWEYSKGKIKDVDLGTLNWLKFWYNENENWRIYANLPSKVKGQNNLLTKKYVTSNTDDGTMSDISITGSNSNLYIYIKDSSYSAQGADALIASLQGVILYYESNDWEWVELDEADQNFRDYYNVADFGTEQSQSSVPSAALLADVGYYFKKSEVKELTLN